MTSTSELAAAQRVLARCAISSPAQIDIEAIAALYNAEVTYGHLDGGDARVVGSLDRSIIRVRSDVSRTRQRFSVAHELGHLLLDPPAAFQTCTGADMSALARELGNRVEARANGFAAELLMPRKMLPGVVRKRLTLDTARTVADRFEVSMSAAARRVLEVGGLPGILVEYSPDGQRRWFCRGSGIPQHYWPAKTLPEGSLAAEFAARGPGFSEANWVSACDWVDARRELDVDIFEHSHIRRDGGVLSLLWWRDESEL